MLYRTLGGLLWTWYCTFRFHKCQGIYWLAEWLISFWKTLLHGVRYLVKIKLSLCLSILMLWRCMGHWGKAHFLDLGTTDGEWPVPCPGCFTAKETASSMHCRGCEWIPEIVWKQWQREKFLYLPGCPANRLSLYKLQYFDSELYLSVTDLAAIRPLLSTCVVSKPKMS
jgi:hypothetical protein